MRSRLELRREGPWAAGVFNVHRTRERAGYRAAAAAAAVPLRLRHDWPGEAGNETRKSAAIFDRGRFGLKLLLEQGVVGTEGGAEAPPRTAEPAEILAASCARQPRAADHASDKGDDLPPGQAFLRAS